MKKYIIILSALLVMGMMAGCSAKEIEYSKDTKVMVCTRPYTSTYEVNGEVVAENYREGIMEDTYWVEEGLLVKHKLAIITPVSEFEDIEQQLADDLATYETLTYEFEGLRSEEPYMDGENYVESISIEDYTNLTPYLEKGYIPSDVVNQKGDAIIFDVYYKKYIEILEVKPTCTISK